MHRTPAPIDLPRASPPNAIAVIGGNRSAGTCECRRRTGVCWRGANASAHLHG